MDVCKATLALALTLGLAVSARADEDSLPNSLRAGAYYVTYHVHADDLTGPYVPPGVNFTLKDVVTPYFAYVRSLPYHLSVELAFGAPPVTKTVGKGPAEVGSVPYNGQVVTTARWLAPTLLLEYNFLEESSLIRPYIGVGVNYTKFYDRQSTAAGNAASGGPTSVSLPVSVGVAGTVGLNLRITPRMHLYASYSASDVSSHLTATTAGIRRTTHIQFGPQATVVSVGYSF